MDRKTYILREIRRVARALAIDHLSERAFQQAGSVRATSVMYHFGSWNRAVKAAGLKPNIWGKPRPGRNQISEEELLSEIGVLWRKLSRKPTDALMVSDGKYSVTPYRKRWGSFRKAVNEYLRRHGEPRECEPRLSAVMPVTPGKHNSLALRKTQKAKRPKNRAATYCGEPLDLRGLRYAPINEQGVVHLFGIVGLDLGFLVESMRTIFPDCEAKRSVDEAGTKWQHVRIEFEYKSKNFMEHGHDPNRCDLIVCWLHDWEECPLEVLELKAAIKCLPRG